MKISNTSLEKTMTVEGHQGLPQLRKPVTKEETQGGPSLDLHPKVVVLPSLSLAPYTDERLKWRLFPWENDDKLLKAKAVEAGNVFTASLLTRLANSEEDFTGGTHLRKYRKR